VSSLPCDMAATWQPPDAFCRERGWSLRRLLYELREGTVEYRTLPEGHSIDWHNPDDEQLLLGYLAKGEVTIVRDVKTGGGPGYV
jgi:quercetin dioxygenase-like cupin family protein